MDSKRVTKNFNERKSIREMNNGIGNQNKTWGVCASHEKK